MANLTDIVKEKPDLNDVSGDTNYLGYWGKLTGVIDAGREVSHSGSFWVSTESIADVTTSEPGDSNDSWYKVQDAVYNYAVSQLAGGDESKVGYIYKGNTVGAVEYFIWPDDGRIYLTNGATGTFADPLDFNAATGTATGITGTLLELSVTTDLSKKTVSITMTDATYTLSASEDLYGRIEISGALTSAQELIIGDEERFLTVKNTTSQTVTVKTLSGSGVKVFSNCTAILLCDSVNVEDNGTPVGENQIYVNETSNRAIGVTETNNTGRPIKIIVTTTNSAGQSADTNISVNGGIVASQRSYGNSPLVPFSCAEAVIPVGAEYTVTGNTLSRWSELKND